MYTSRQFSRHRAAATIAVLGALASAGLATTTTATASAAPSKGNAQFTNKVTAAAWAAGRAAKGRDVTAAEAVAAYWTPARMRAAQPVEESPGFRKALAAQRKDAATASAARTAKRSTTRRGKRFEVPPVAGKLGLRARLAATNPNLNYWSPTAYTTGKVFFTQFGRPKECSAAIISSEGADTVWTAGHCLHSGGGYGVWSTNVPSCRPTTTTSPTRSRMAVVGRTLYSRNAWISNKYEGEDLGVMIMHPSSAGTHIVNYFGGHGFPRTCPSTRRRRRSAIRRRRRSTAGTCSAARATCSRSGTTGRSARDVIWMPCDMNGGASGGPWLWAYNGNLGYLNGVNSLGTQVEASIMASPYFGNNALSLYNATRYL